MPNTFFETINLDDITDDSLNKSAQREQTNVSPSKLFVKTPQQSNLQKSQLKCESTSFHDTLEHDSNFNSDPPCSQASSSDASLTDTTL